MMRLPISRTEPLARRQHWCCWPATRREPSPTRPSSTVTRLENNAKQIKQHLQLGTQLWSSSSIVHTQHHPSPPRPVPTKPTPLSTYLHILNPFLRLMRERDKYYSAKINYKKQERNYKPISIEFTKFWFSSVIRQFQLLFCLFAGSTGIKIALAYRTHTATHTHTHTQTCSQVHCEVLVATLQFVPVQLQLIESVASFNFIHFSIVSSLPQLPTTSLACYSIVQ